MPTSTPTFRAVLLLALAASAAPVAVTLRAAAGASPTAAVSAPLARAAGAPGHGRIETVADTQNGTADVIAHAVVDLGGGSYRWASTAHATDVVPTQLASDAPAFLLAGGRGATVVTSQSGTRWLLGAGEALFRPAGSLDTVVRVDGEPASLVAWSLVAADGDSTFRVEPGPRDIELLRDVVGPGDVLVLPGGSPPTLAVPTDGVAVARDPGSGTETALDAERPTLFDTAREISAGEGTATVVALVIGAGLAPAGRDVTDPADTAEAPTTPSLSTEPQTPPPQTLPPPTPPPTPTTAAPVITGGPLRTDVTSMLPPTSSIVPPILTTTTRAPGGGGGGGGGDCNPDGPGGNPCQQQ